MQDCGQYLWGLALVPQILLIMINKDLQLSSGCTRRQQHATSGLMTTTTTSKPQAAELATNMIARTAACDHRIPEEHLQSLCELSTEVAASV